MPYGYRGGGDAQLIRALLLNPRAEIGNLGRGARPAPIGEPAGLPAWTPEAVDDDAATPTDGFHRSRSEDARQVMEGLMSSAPAESEAAGNPALDYLSRRADRREALQRKAARELLGYAEGADLSSAAEAARRESWRDLQAQRRESGEPPAMGVQDAQSAIEKWQRFGGPKPPPWAFAAAGTSEAAAESQREGTRHRNRDRMARDLRARAERGHTGRARGRYQDPITGEVRTLDDPGRDLTPEEKDELFRRAAEIARQAKP